MNPQWNDAISRYKSVKQKYPDVSRPINALLDLIDSLSTVNELANLDLIPIHGGTASLITKSPKREVSFSSGPEGFVDIWEWDSGYNVINKERVEFDLAVEEITRRVTRP